MKKILAIAVALTAFVAVAAAQPRALGVRFGSASYAAGYGAELSYQHGLGTTNFVEIDLGWSSVGINGTASWDYILAEFGGGFDFYAGPGANLGMYNTADGAKFAVGALAQVGLEYQFGTIPFNISLDWRPTFYVIPSTYFSATGVALAFRYRF